jgi:hypothetical protein
MLRPNSTSRVISCALIVAGFGFLGNSRAHAGFTLGDAANYAILFEGAAGNTLQITNVTVNGNVGVGNTGKATDSGPSTVNGGIFFANGNTGQFSNNNNGTVITGGVHFGDMTVTLGLNTVNALNTALGKESGTNIAIGTGGGMTLTVNGSNGVLDNNGNRVFNVTNFNTTNGNILTINGDAAGDSVVLNFTSSANFNNQVILNGISSDQVLFNFVGGSNLTGGSTLQINDNASASSSNVVQGVFLDPNGAISIVNANVRGRVFGGDTHDFQYVSGSTLTAPSPVSPVPEPPTVIMAVVGLASLGAARRFVRRRPELAVATL